MFGLESLWADERVLNAVCTALITLYHISHNQLKYSFFCKQKVSCLWLILVKNEMNVNYLMIYIEAASAVRTSNKFTSERNWQRKLILIKSEFLELMELCGFILRQLRNETDSALMFMCF